MPRRLYRILVPALLILCLSGNITCRAAAPEVSASAYVLMEAESGRVLLSRNETQERAIASTTKIMTALVALEHGRLDALVTVKREHLKEGSSMYLREGETLTLEALLYGLMLPSGNDAAECIADFCGDGTERFVAWMNEKAAALGMTHTHFANPSGLDAEGHYSCALDMARLAACAMRDPVFARLVSTQSAQAGERVMSNHNKLLGSLEGCIGLKTGYTGAAGRTLVTCAQRDGLRLIAVTLHDGNDWQDHALLYEYGFSAYRSVLSVRRGEVLALVPVRGGTLAAVQAAAAAQLAYPLADGEAAELHIVLTKALDAPVKAGDRLGTIELLLDDKTVASTDLVAVSAVAAAEPAPVERRGLLSQFLHAITG